MKASELFKRSPWIKALVYGKPGTGKTTWAAKSPNPLYILTEPHGIPVVCMAAPDAEIDGCPSWPAFQAAMKRVAEGRKTEQGIVVVNKEGNEVLVTTIIIDSLTDLHDRMAQYYNVSTSEGGWMRVASEMRDLMQFLRTLPVNIVCLCLAQIKDDDKSVRVTIPDLFGKAATSVGQYFNAIGYAHKSKVGDEPAYGIAWDVSSSAFVTKRLPGSDATVPAVTVSPVGKRGATLGAIAAAWLAGSEVVPVTCPEDDPSEVSVERAEMPAAAPPKQSKWKPAAKA